MTSLILRTATKYLFPVIMLFSLYLLMRGHNEPGGGFVGGLAAASAYTLYALAFDVATARRILRVDSRTVIAWGLLVALSSGLLSFLNGAPFMTSIWGYLDLSSTFRIPLGTPLFFDIGVYLVVLGVTLTIMFGLAEGHREEG